MTCVELCVLLCTHLSMRMHTRSILGSLRLVPDRSQCSLHCSWEHHQKAQAVLTNLPRLAGMAVLENLRRLRRLAQHDMAASAGSLRAAIG